MISWNRNHSSAVMRPVAGASRGVRSHSMSVRSEVWTESAAASRDHARPARPVRSSPMKPRNNGTRLRIEGHRCPLVSSSNSCTAVEGSLPEGEGRHLGGSEHLGGRFRLGLNAEVRRGPLPRPYTAGPSSATTRPLRVIATRSPRCTIRSQALRRFFISRTPDVFGVSECSSLWPQRQGIATEAAGTRNNDDLDRSRALQAAVRARADDAPGATMAPSRT